MSLGTRNSIKIRRVLSLFLVLLLLIVTYGQIIQGLLFSYPQGVKEQLETSTSPEPVDTPAQLLKRKKEAFTIVISTFDRDTKLIPNIDYWLTCPFVNQVHIIWHDPERKPPDYFYRMRDQYNCESKKDIGFCTKCDFCSNERLIIREQVTNDITNRFKKPIKGYKTDAIFSVDDDVIIDCRLLNHAFNKWKELGYYSIVGFEPRIYDWYHMSKGYFWNKACQERYCYYNTLFITKGGFIHSDFFNYFFEEQFKEIRDLIVEYITGEDMLMSFVFFIKTIQLTGKQPKIMTIQKSFDFKTSFTPLLERVVDIYQTDFFQTTPTKRPLLKYQQEGDGIDLSGRTGRFRPDINEEIRNTAMKIFDSEIKPEFQHNWEFVNLDETTFTLNSSVLCQNRSLQLKLACSQRNSLKIGP